MKKTLLSKNALRSLFWCFAIMTLMLPGKGFGQLLTENFNYTSSTTLISNGWTASSGTGTNNLTVNGTGLTYAGSITNGIGNSVVMASNGEDVGRAVANTTTTAYASFLVKVNTAQTGDYFIGILSGTGFISRVYVKTTTGGYLFGCSKATGAVTYDTSVRALGSTYLVVVKYKANTASTSDDVVDLWINPALGGTESTPTATANLGTDPTLAATTGVFIRQGGATTASTQEIDGIILGTTWASVTPSSAPIVTAASQTGTVGTAFSYNIVATNSPTSYAVSSGTLPAGLSLNTTNGIISGTPTTAETQSVSVTATNSSGTSAPAILNFNISAAGLASQTITFGALAAATYGNATFGLTATASSGLPVTYASSNTAVATISGDTVTIVGAGSTNITASQSGNGSYNPAADVVQTLTVNTKSLTVPDAAAVSKTYTGNNTASITGTLSGVINSDDVTFTGTGTFTDVNVANDITVTSSSTLGGSKASNYMLIQPTTLSANITPASQTLNFAATAQKYTISPDYSSATSATSGINSISYTSSNLGVATIVSGMIHIVGVGTTTITASQAASRNYTAAADKSQLLTVVSAPIAGWDFAGVASTGVSAFAATTFNSDLLSATGASDITRGTTAPLSTGANSFRTVGFKNDGIATTNTDYFQVTLSPTVGKIVSLTTIDTDLIGTSTYAASPGVTSQFAYSLDGTNFTLIGSPQVIIGTPQTLAQIDLSGIPALQNISNGTTATLRYYASGQTTTGGWGLASGTTTGAFGLAIGGSIVTTSTTWNGSSWNNGIPSATIDAIIEGAYSTSTDGTFTAKKLTVNSGKSLTINSGTNLTIQNEIINNGTVTLENNANLIQVDNTSNTGEITINRNGASLMLLDYSLWSSPVRGQKLKAFSPNTLDDRFYTYNPITNIYVPLAAPATTDFALGNGYLIRVPNNHPTTPTIWNGVFKGVPNNGDVTITGLTSDMFNAVGNPYPSTISADAFITANSITEPLYFWRKTNAAAGTAYATYTMAGAVGTPGNGGITPNGTIQVGQGFIVKTTSNSVAFANTMRTANTANQILKTTTTEKNRIWLNLSKGTEPVNQMMVAYMDGATSEIDNTLDGRYINDNETALTSSLKGEEFVIQAKGLPFDSGDIVPLSFKTELAGSFTIAIDKVDGLFLGNQEIVLKDLKAGTEQNLKTGSYTFTSEAGTFKNRFEIAFKNNQTLDINTPNFDKNSVMVFNQNGTLNVSTGKNTIKNIRVFDIRGVLIAEQKEVNANTASIKNVTASKQAVLIQITSEDNKTVTKKAIF